MNYSYYNSVGLFYVLAFVVNIFVVLFVVRHVLIIDLKKKLYNKRHCEKPASIVSNLGGVAIFTSFLILNSIFSHWQKIDNWNILLAVATFLFFTGLRHDLVCWHKYTLLAIDLIASLVLVFMIGIKVQIFGSLDARLPYAFTEYLSSFFVLFLSIRFAKYLDEIEGLLSAVALFSFIIFGCAFSYLSNYGLAIICCSMCGILIGFLKSQLAKKKISLGRSGYSLIGLTLGYLSLCLINLSYNVIINSHTSYANPTIFIPISISFILIPLMDICRRIYARLFLKVSWNQSLAFPVLLSQAGFDNRQISVLIILIQLHIVLISFLLRYLDLGVIPILTVLIAFSSIIMWIVRIKYNHKIIGFENKS